MIECILVITGLIIFTKAIFDKKGTWNIIMKHGSKSKLKFIYKLTHCKFCMMFHTGVLLTIFYGLFFGFYHWMIIVPFVVSGLTYNEVKK